MSKKVATVKSLEEYYNQQTIDPKDTAGFGVAPLYAPQNKYAGQGGAIADWRKIHEARRQEDKEDITRRKNLEDFFSDTPEEKDKKDVEGGLEYVNRMAKKAQEEYLSGSEQPAYIQTTDYQYGEPLTKDQLFKGIRKGILYYDPASRFVYRRYNENIHGMPRTERVPIAAVDEWGNVDVVKFEKSLTGDGPWDFLLRSQPFMQFWNLLDPDIDAKRFEKLARDDNLPMNISEGIGAGLNRISSSWLTNPLRNILGGGDTRYETPAKQHLRPSTGDAYAPMTAPERAESTKGYNEYRMGVGLGDAAGKMAWMMGLMPMTGGSAPFWGGALSAAPMWLERIGEGVTAERTPMEAGTMAAVDFFGSGLAVKYGSQVANNYLKQMGQYKLKTSLGRYAAKQVLTQTAIAAPQEAVYQIADGGFESLTNLGGLGDYAQRLGINLALNTAFELATGMSLRKLNKANKNIFAASHEMTGDPIAPITLIDDIKWMQQQNWSPLRMYQELRSAGKIHSDVSVLRFGKLIDEVNTLESGLRARGVQLGKQEPSMPSRYAEGANPSAVTMPREKIPAPSEIGGIEGVSTTVTGELVPENAIKNMETSADVGFTFQNMKAQEKNLSKQQKEFLKEVEVLAPRGEFDSPEFKNNVSQMYLDMTGMTLADGIERYGGAEVARHIKAITSGKINPWYMIDTPLEGTPNTKIADEVTTRMEGGPEGTAKAREEMMLRNEAGAAYKHYVERLADAMGVKPENGVYSPDDIAKINEAQNILAKGLGLDPKDGSIMDAFIKKYQGRSGAQMEKDFQNLIELPTQDLPYNIRKSLFGEKISAEGEAQASGGGETATTPPEPEPDVVKTTELPGEQPKKPTEEPDDVYTEDDYDLAVKRVEEEFAGKRARGETYTLEEANKAMEKINERLKTEETKPSEEASDAGGSNIFVGPGLQRRLTPEGKFKAADKSTPTAPASATKGESTGGSKTVTGTVQKPKPKKEETVTPKKEEIKKLKTKGFSTSKPEPEAAATPPKQDAEVKTSKPKTESATAKKKTEYPEKYEAGATYKTYDSEGKPDKVVELISKSGQSKTRETWDALVRDADGNPESETFTTVSLPKKKTVSKESDTPIQEIIPHEGKIILRDNSTNKVRIINEDGTQVSSENFTSVEEAQAAIDSDADILMESNIGPSATPLSRVAKQTLTSLASGIFMYYLVPDDVDAQLKLAMVMGGLGFPWSMRNTSMFLRAQRRYGGDIPYAHLEKMRNSIKVREAIARGEDPAEVYESAIRMYRAGDQELKKFLQHDPITLSMHNAEGDIRYITEESYKGKNIASKQQAETKEQAQEFFNSTRNKPAVTGRKDVARITRAAIVYTGNKLRREITAIRSDSFIQQFFNDGNAVGLTRYLNQKYNHDMSVAEATQLIEEGTITDLRNTILESVVSTDRLKQEILKSFQKFAPGKKVNMENAMAAWEQWRRVMDMQTRFLVDSNLKMAYNIRLEDVPERIKFLDAEIDRLQRLRKQKSEFDEALATLQDEGGSPAEIERVKATIQRLKFILNRTNVQYLRNERNALNRSLKFIEDAKTNYYQPEWDWMGQRGQYPVFIKAVDDNGRVLYYGNPVNNKYAFFAKSPAERKKVLKQWLKDHNATPIKDDAGNDTGMFEVDAVDFMGRTVDADGIPTIEPSRIARVRVRVTDHLSTDQMYQFHGMKRDEIRNQVARLFQVSTGDLGVAGSRKMQAAVEELIALINPEILQDITANLTRLEKSLDMVQTDSIQNQAEIQKLRRDLLNLQQAINEAGGTQELAVRLAADYSQMGEISSEIADLHNIIRSLWHFTNVPGIITPNQHRNFAGWEPTSLREWDNYIEESINQNSLSASRAMSRGYTVGAIDDMIVKDFEYGISNRNTDYKAELRHDLTKGSSGQPNKITYVAGKMVRYATLRDLMLNASSVVTNFAFGNIATMGYLTYQYGPLAAFHWFPAAVRTGKMTGHRFWGTLQSTKDAIVRGDSGSSVAFSNTEAVINQMANGRYFADDELNSMAQEWIRRRGWVETPMEFFTGGAAGKNDHLVYVAQRGTEFINRNIAVLSYLPVWRKNHPRSDYPDISDAAYIDLAVNEAQLFAGATQGNFDIIFRSKLERKVASNPYFKNLLVMLSPAFRQLYTWNTIITGIGRGNQAGMPQNWAKSTAALMGVTLATLMYGGYEAMPYLSDAITIANWAINTQNESNDKKDKVFDYTGNEQIRKAIDKATADLQDYLVTELGAPKNSVANFSGIFEDGLLGMLMGYPRPTNEGLMNYTNPYILSTAENLYRDADKIAGQIFDGIEDPEEFVSQVSKAIAPRFVDKAMRASWQLSLGEYIDREANAMRDGFGVGAAIGYALFGDEMMDVKARSAEYKSSIPMVTEQQRKDFLQKMVKTDGIRYEVDGRPKKQQYVYSLLSGKTDLESTKQLRDLAVDIYEDKDMQKYVKSSLDMADSFIENNERIFRKMVYGDSDVYGNTRDLEAATKQFKDHIKSYWENQALGAAVLGRVQRDKKLSGHVRMYYEPATKEYNNKSNLTFDLRNFNLDVPEEIDSIITDKFPPVDTMPPEQQAFYFAVIKLMNKEDFRSMTE